MIKVDLRKKFSIWIILSILEKQAQPRICNKGRCSTLYAFFEYMDYMRNELNIVILYDLPKPIIIVTKGYTIH